MSKAPSPLLGFNNNIKHKGRLFHVQTEDSGVRHPHVITHLFMDGGRILKTVKTSYAEYIGAENMGEVVKKLMKEQHKAMFVALRDGAFDEAIAKGTSGAMAAIAAAKAAAVAEASAVSVRAPEPAPPPAATAPAEAKRPASSPPSSSYSTTSPRSAPAESRPADLSTLERAAAEAKRPPSIIPFGPGQGDLPPPPATVLQKPVLEGGYSEVVPPNEIRRRTAPPTMPPPPPAAPVAPPQSASPQERVTPEPPAPAAPKKHGSGRYSVSRPTSPFATNRPPEGRSIFGEDLISEKSLDEVILSYLAEDLETPPKK